MKTPFALEVGHTYYVVTHADAGMTMPGLDPLVYIGESEPDGHHLFQDTVSYVRFGSRLQMNEEQPGEMQIHAVPPEGIGSGIQTLAQAIEAVQARRQRAIELGHPKLPVLRQGWVSANAPAIRDAMINIDVPDLEAALRFYAQGLGLTLARRLFDNTVAEMEGAPCLLYLLEKKAQSGALPQQDAKRDYGRHWTPVHLDFVVDRLESSIERLIAAGARLESGPTDFAWGRQATFSDPFGHGICLIQWLGRGYGEVTSELGEESPPAQAAGRTGIQTMYQAWKTQDGAAFFPASRLGEMRANPAMTLEALLFEIEANTYEEAAAIYNLRMGFGPYQPGGDPAPCPNCGAWFYPQGSGECWRCGKIA